MQNKPSEITGLYSHFELLCIRRKGCVYDWQDENLIKFKVKIKTKIKNNLSVDEIDYARFYKPKKIK